MKRKAVLYPRSILLAIILLSIAFIAGRTGFDISAVADLMGTDSYLRLLTVDKLLQGADWYNHTIERTNWPHGLQHHWTRPVDLLLWPLASLFPILTAAFIYQLMLLLLFAWGMALTASKLGATLTNLALPALILALYSNPYTLAYFTPGRVDHHALLATLLVWLLYALVSHRILLAGVLAGIGVWVSVEFFLPLFFISLWLGLAWLQQPQKYHAVPRRFFLAMLAFMSVGILMERPMAAFTLVEPDNLSWPYWVMIALTTAAAGILSLRSAWECSLPMRLLKALLYGLGIFIVTFTAFPDLLKLGFVPLQDPLVTAHFHSQVSELRSPLDDEHFFTLFVPLLLALPTALIRLYRESWPLPAVALLITAIGMSALLLTAFRWMYYAVPVALLLFSYGISDSRWKTRRILRMLLIFSVVLLPLSAMLNQMEKTIDTADSRQSICKQEESKLIRQNLLGDNPLTLAIHPNRGYEILFFTPHRILAANNHRNTEGLGDLLRALQADKETADEIIQRRGIDIVITCTDAKLPEWKPHPLSQQMQVLKVWNVR